MLLGAAVGHGSPAYRVRQRVRNPVGSGRQELSMCRNIKMLFNFDPPATPEEVRAAALQFVRKISGFTKPSKTNEAAFQQAIEEVTQVSMRLLSLLETHTAPRNREEEAAKAKIRSATRFGTSA
jgi:hypothetical protein